MNDKIYISVNEKEYIPIRYLIKKTINKEIIKINDNIDSIIEKGIKYIPAHSPNLFKYQLGSYIEALNNGANILISSPQKDQYGISLELQVSILEEIGYNFRYIDLSNASLPFIKLYQYLKEYSAKLYFFKYIYYLIQSMLIMKFTDKIENYRRINSISQNNKRKLEFLSSKMKLLYNRDKLSIYKIIRIYLKIKKKQRSILGSHAN